MSEVKPVGSGSNLGLQAASSGPTLGDALDTLGTVAVVAASVSVGEALTDFMVQEGQKRSPSQKISGLNRFGIRLMGTSLGLMAGGCLIGSENVARAGALVMAGTVLTLGTGVLLFDISQAKSPGNKIGTGMVGVGALAIGVSIGYFMLFDWSGGSSSNRVASTLSHIAVSENGVAATGQF